jgi:hypothetical protein
VGVNVGRAARPSLRAETRVSSLFRVHESIDPAATPMHVLRFGEQTDYQGLLGGSRDSEYRIGYLCKLVAG